ALQVGEDVFHEDLAAKLLTEEAHVAADHGSEIEQPGGRGGRQRYQEFAERLGRKDGIAGRRRRGRMRLGFRATRSDAVEKAHKVKGKRKSLTFCLLPSGVQGAPMPQRAEPAAYLTFARQPAVAP